MISIRNLLFLAVAVTGSVIKRDVATISKDLKTINSDTQAVADAVNKYNGGGTETTAILSAEKQLTKDIKTATNNAKGVKANDAEAKDIIKYITGTFEPSIDSALSALKKQKGNFQKHGLTSAVKHILESLKSDSSEYSKVLVASTPANQKDKAENVKKDIIGKFDDAIKAFS